MGMCDQSKISPCEKCLLGSLNVLRISDDPSRDLSKTIYYFVVGLQKKMRALLLCPLRQLILTGQFTPNTLNAINDALRV